MEGDCFSKMATDLWIGCCVVVNLLISPNVDVMSFMLNSTTHVRILHTLDVAYFIFDAPVNNFFKLLADAYSITAAADLIYSSLLHLYMSMHGKHQKYRALIYCKSSAAQFPKNQAPPRLCSVAPNLMYCTWPGHN